MRYEVIIDWGETPNKCTIAPLLYRTDFSVRRVARKLSLGTLTSSILLHPAGTCLLELRDAPTPVESIAAIDSVWKRVAPLMRRIEGPLPQLARIPDGFVTAYPRKSAGNKDPAGGLATIEALFTAAALLGSWDPGLLAEYYFGSRFIELNSQRFLGFGVPQAGQPELWPKYSPRPKHSLQRRFDRGRCLPAHLLAKPDTIR